MSNLLLTVQLEITSTSLYMWRGESVCKVTCKEFSPTQRGRETGGEREEREGEREREREIRIKRGHQ